MIFLTVGSSLPFDRLIRLIDEAVDDVVLKDEVFAQIGTGAYVPRCLRFTRFLGKQDYDTYFRNASLIISHAGIGTISAALRSGKPILVMPRRKEFQELVDDHQLATARKFADLGHLLMFSDRIELGERIDQLADFRPKERKPNVEGVATIIGDYLTKFASTTENRRNRS